EFTARLGFFAFVIVRRSPDHAWPRFVERLTCSVQSVPATPPTRSHQAIHTVLESVGSTAIDRSAPRRSCPMLALKRMKRLVATRCPTTPSPAGGPGSASAPNGEAPPPQLSSRVTTMSTFKLGNAPLAQRWKAA